MSWLISLMGNVGGKAYGRCREARRRNSIRPRRPRVELVCDEASAHTSGLGLVSSVGGRGFISPGVRLGFSRGFNPEVTTTMTVIKVENIGKRFRVGHYESHGLLTEQLGRALRDPLSLLRPRPKKRSGPSRTFSST